MTRISQIRLAQKKIAMLHCGHWLRFIIKRLFIIGYSSFFGQLDEWCDWLLNSSKENMCDKEIIYIESL
jgi:hypothetical protein